MHQWLCQPLHLLLGWLWEERGKIRHILCSLGVWQLKGLGWSYLEEWVVNLDPSSSLCFMHIVLLELKLYWNLAPLLCFLHNLSVTAELNFSKPSSGPH